MTEKSQRAVFARTAVVILFLLISPDLFAYLDPSTGSMVVTALVGIFASLGLAVKTYWYKFKKLFRRAAKKPADSGNNSNPKD